MRIISIHQRGKNLEDDRPRCIDCAMYQIGCRSEELLCCSCCPEYRRIPGDWRIVIDRLLIRITRWWLKHGNKGLY
jgi:hypothetical protein